MRLTHLKSSCRLVLLYILNYIDRSALSSARTKGFEADLGISDQQMDTLLSIREYAGARHRPEHLHES